MSDDSLYDIAVVGMAGRFPKASGIESFWSNLCQGLDCVTEFEKQQLIDAGLDADQVNNPAFVPKRASMEGVDLFDAALFGFSPKEAEAMDPQNRLFLECAWEALENAGCDPQRYPGPIGVYAGSSTNSYVLRAMNPKATSMTGYALTVLTDREYLTTQVSYKLDLKGPSFDVQTACSTSLVAAHLACQGLLSRECDMALAGGVSARVPQEGGYLYVDDGMNPPDGVTRAFDVGGRGPINGSGVGIVVLKRLEDALQDGDSIIALIKGSAINNDGSSKAGFSAPSVDGQAAAISEALGMADVDPATISFVECHGTATVLGDPIEVAALTKAFRGHTERSGYCAIGSVKTNIGHTDAAAGVAGLIKASLALQHRRLPASLHFEQPNPRIDFENSPFFVADKPIEFPADGTPLRAGVSAFGLGGTNAHMVLEEAPPAMPSGESRRNQLLLLSARTPEALNAAGENLVGHLEAHSDLNLADAAFTLQMGRRQLEQRRFVIAGSAADAASALSQRDPKRVFGGAVADESPTVCFLFPGAGPQHLGMGRELYETEPAFRSEIDRCSKLLEPQLGFDLSRTLYPAADEEEAAGRRMERIRPALCGLFAVEYALSRLWMSWGVRPGAMIGHSQGEYAAACLAGVFSLEDALSLVCLRARLFEQMPSGAMLSVALGEEELTDLLGDDLSLGVINGPESCVLSGSLEAIDRAESQLAQRGVELRRPKVGLAAHSHLIDGIREEFLQAVRSMEMKAPEIPFVSNVTGTWITPQEATDPHYWSQHLRQTVRFSQGVQELLHQPSPVLIEVGPGRMLGTLAKQHPESRQASVIDSMRHAQDQDGPGDQEVLLRALGKAWLRGVEVDWKAFAKGEKRRRIPLPTYPFEHRPYLLEPISLQDLGGPQRLPKNSDMSQWFYVPIWKRTARPSDFASSQPFDPSQSWLIWAQRGAMGLRLARYLRDQGLQATVVQEGEGFEQRDRHNYVIRSTQPADWLRLIEDLEEGDRFPHRIVHLGGLQEASGEDRFVRCEGRLDLGYYSLVFLAQALAQRKPSRSVFITAVSSRGALVHDGEELRPEMAMLTPLCKVIPQEIPNVSARHVDLAPIGPDGDDAIAELLALEAAADFDDPAAAYREGQRWVQDFQRVTIEERPKPPRRLRSGGVCLITGGLGGVGLELGESMVREAGAKLALLGRSEVPPREEWDALLDSSEAPEKLKRRLRKLKDLESIGAEFLTLKADVSDLEQMRQAVARTRERFGEIHSVIHSAGIPQGGMIQFKQRDESLDVLSVKVKGTLILEELFRDQDLDFFALCSSLNAIGGGFGQLDYAAANVFMDAFAHCPDPRHSKVSINWCAWQDVGMLLDIESPKGYQDYRKAADLEQMLGVEGSEVFLRILDTRLPQVAVSYFDYLKELARELAFRPDELLEEGLKATERDSSASLPRPQLSSEFVAPRNDTEGQVVALWEEMLGIDSIGVHDDFFELGGHSLLLAQVLAWIRDTFQAELSMQTLFEGPTPAEWAAAIDAARPGSESEPEAGAGQDQGQDQALQRMIGEIQQMSAEELEEALESERMVLAQEDADG